VTALAAPARPRWSFPVAATVIAASLVASACSDGGSDAGTRAEAIAATDRAPAASSSTASTVDAAAAAAAEAQARAAAEAEAAADAQAAAQAAAAAAAAEAEAKARAAAEAEAAAKAAAEAEAERVAVLGVQQRLAELGYSPGAADGRVGGRTSSAIMAFQKVEGLDPTGDVDAALIERLAAPQSGPTAGGGGPRIDVDLARQVVTVTTPAGTRVFNASTGNGEEFDWGDGTTGVAYTPTGSYAVERRIEGMDVGPLGAMYRPLYFVGGWAVHGSGHVPAYPASHGCVRVSNADQDWIWENIPNGATVNVF
jgi:lipoprotein-anchoring transpeptidase ErfK/SrfK